MQISPQVTDPKQKQFFEELNELLGKFQYAMKPTLQYNQTGIMPLVSFINVPPPKKEGKKGKDDGRKPA